MEEGMSAFKILKGKPTRKRAPGRPRGRRKEAIRTDLKGKGVNTRNLTDSAQDRDY